MHHGRNADSFENAYQTMHHGRGCILDDSSREEYGRFRKCRGELAGGWDAYQTTHDGKEAQYGGQVGMHTRRHITGAVPRDGAREGMHPGQCIAGERPTVLSTGDIRDAYGRTHHRRGTEAF
jgi:hypothetical protein